MTKISQYTSMTTLQSGDLMDISEDLGGSYGSRSLTYSNLLTNLNNDLAIPTVGATQYQVPYVNTGATDFDYSANLTYDGSIMTLVSPLLINTNNELRLGSNTANYNALKSPTGMGSNLTYTLPSAYPTSTGQVLASTTTGTMTWEDNAEPIVKYATDEAELTAAFASLNASGTGGIVKLGGDITLTGNISLDFGAGIELWGGNNYINATASNFTVTFVGAKFSVKDVIFNGSSKNLSATGGSADDTTNMLIFNSALTTFTSFQNCTFSNLVGSTNFASPAGYVIDIQDQATDLTMAFIGSKITSGGASNKPYQPFRIKYSVGSTKGSVRLQFRDWACTGIGSATAARWQDAKGALLMRIDSMTHTPAYKHAFLYDESVTWDVASESSGTPTQWLDLFPTFYGPTTKVLSGTDPTTGGGYFGNPGDIIIGGTTTESIYMKHTSIATDTNWSKIN
tara:strand:+ start:8 stop:1369 length:1362 start_codon:yes stop_codon:yes gene_type:complete